MNKEEIDQEFQERFKDQIRLCSIEDNICQEMSSKYDTKNLPKTKENKVWALFSRFLN